MNMDLSNFTVLKEDNDNYHVGHPNGKNLVVAKRGLSEGAKAAIEKIKGKRQHFDVGGEVADQSAIDAPAAPPTDAPARDLASDAGAINYTPIQGPDTQAAPTAAPMTPAPPPEKAEDLLAKSYKENVAGIEAEAKAKEDQATAIGKTLDQGIAEYKALPTQTERLQARRAANDELYKAYQSQKLDPNHYWADQGTSGRLAAGVGLILSGLGQGLGGGPNLAHQVIESGINRDIEAQKNAQDKSMNLWKMNMEQYHNEAAADTETRNQMLTGLKLKIESASNSFQGPLAQARKQQLLAQVDQEQSKLNQQMSMFDQTKDSVGGASPGTEQAEKNRLNYMQVYAPAMYKDEVAKVIPGVGKATVPLDPDDRHEIANWATLRKAVNRAIVFQTSGAGAAGGAYSGANRGEALAIQHAVTDAYNQIIDSKRPPSPEAAKELSKVFGNPGSFDLTGKNAGAYKGLATTIDDRFKTLTNSLGVAPFKESPKILQAKAWLDSDKARSASPEDRNKVLQIVNEESVGQ